MSSVHVLIVSESGYLPETVPGIIEERSARDILADVSTALDDTLTKVSSQEFDAIVCWVEHPDELNGILRIRRRDPRIPVLVLTPREDPAIRERALRYGASEVSRQDRHPEAIAEYLRLAVISGQLQRDFHRQVRRARELTDDIGVLAKSTAELIQTARKRKGEGPKTSFIPLLVEDDLEQAFLMVRAFAKAEVFTPLPVLRSCAEAITFLTGSAPFDRDYFPRPSVVLVNASLPGNSALEVLQWIRQHSPLAAVPVVMLKSSWESAEIQRAYELGANSCLVKPKDFEELVSVITNLKNFWAANLRPVDP